MPYTIPSETKVQAIPMREFNMSVVYKGLPINVRITKSAVHKTSWEWETLGRSGREVTQEKAIEAARCFVLETRS